MEDAGYNYYGTETLYSGINGVEMTAEIFMGVIHYQRLRDGRKISGNIFIYNRPIRYRQIVYADS